MFVTYMEKQKLANLKFIYDDKVSIAKTMRENLASDIKCGYGLANVVRQMVAIEDYEKKVVESARREYEEYKTKLDAKNNHYNRAAALFAWENLDV